MGIYLIISMLYQLFQYVFNLHEELEKNKDLHYEFVQGFRTYNESSVSEL